MLEVNYTDPTLTDADKKAYEAKRANVFKGTIAVCAIYGALAFGMLLLVLFTQTGKQVLTDAMLPFTATFVAGTMLIIIFLIINIVKFEPTRLPRADYDATVCPDYWLLEKTPVDELEALNGKSRNLMRYRCRPDPKIFKMQGTSLVNADSDVTNWLYGGTTVYLTNEVVRKGPAQNLVFTTVAGKSDVTDVAVELSCPERAAEGYTNEVELSNPSGSWEGAQTVQVKMFVKAPNGNASMEFFIFEYDGGNRKFSSTVTTVTGDWAEVSFSYTLQYKKPSKVTFRIDNNCDWDTSRRIQITGIRMTQPTNTKTWKNQYGHWLGTQQDGVPMKSLSSASTGPGGYLYSNLSIMYPSINSGTGNGKVQCDMVYPAFLANLDLNKYPDTPNAIRCSYATTCGMPWSSACPAHTAPS